ncbi:MAG: hypothetical protein IH866_06690 [Chloroflexi bacterium]|nr:hypothetical protein [Chloroflexota bacterium]
MGEETTGQEVGELRGQAAERQPGVFDPASEVNGVDTDTVRESIRMQETTQVPDASELVEGVNDLRKEFLLSVEDETKITLPRRRGHRRPGRRGHRPRRDRGYPADRRRDRSGFDDDYD